MDLDIYKSNLSIKQRKLLFAVEKSTLSEVETRLGDLTKSERHDKYLDYLILVTALQRGHKSIIKFLIKNGCSVRIPMTTQIFCTPLYYAVELKDVSIIKDLIKLGASIFDKDKNEVSPFELAVQNHQDLTINAILDDLNVVHQCRNFDPTCKIDLALFHMACRKGRSKAVETFLNNNFPVNSRSEFENEQWSGFTPMHFAVESYSRSVVELLLQHDADLSAIDHRGKTPLLAAFSNTFLGVYQKIFEQYIQDLVIKKFSNPVDKDGLSHFHVVCRGADDIDPEKYVECVQYFINNSVDVNSSTSSEAKNNAGYTALHFAVENMRLNIIECLLKNGADPKKVNAKGLTPLHMVCKNADSKTKEVKLAMANVLLLHGADVDAKDLQNSTPIHYAFQNRYRVYDQDWTVTDPFIQLLLSKSKLSTDITNDYGLSYLHIASCLDLQAVKNLMEHGASVNSCVQSKAPCQPGYSALHFAVSSNRLDIVQYLLDHGVDPNIGVSSDKKVTPLHVYFDYYWNEFFAQFGYWIGLQDKTDRQKHQMLYRTDRLRMMELLLKFGASVNVQDSSGNTPLSNVCGMAANLNIKGNYEEKDQKIIFDEICTRQKLMIDVLVRHGADINSRTRAYASLLHRIARQHARPQRRELAETLLKRGANANSVDNSKHTPLHVAVQEFMKHGFDDGLIDLLLEYGADINAKADYLETPLHGIIANCSSEYGHTRFAQILEKFLNYPSVDLDARDSCGSTLLHKAVHRRDHRSIKILLDSGVDISVENSRKFSPIGSFYDSVKDSPSAVHSGEDLDCFIVLVAHVQKLILTKSYLKENLQEDFKRLAELYPEKFAAIDSSIRNELELLKSKKIDQYTSLFNILFQDSNNMAKHVKNEDLKKIILSPELSLFFPLFGSRLIHQFKMGTERSLILEDAKKTLNFVTCTNWPESCAEHILKYLHNSDLRNIIKSIVTSYKRVRKDSGTTNKPPQKIFRAG